MPDGSTVLITYIGDIKLSFGLQLQQVLSVLDFKFNLLSMSKLTKDADCFVVFYPNFCLIQDCATRVLKGIGKHQAGLYYLVNDDLNQQKVTFMNKPINVNGKPCVATSLVDNLFRHKLLTNLCISEVGLVSKEALWHLRLGHVPMSKIKSIVGGNKTSFEEVCLSYPMSKFFKLPFTLRHTKTQYTFEIVYMDIWGPYRVSTYKGRKYFMTLVDDKSIATWTYLMQQKS